MANLHLILCFSPLGEAFRNRLRMFPSLVNCSTWFASGPHSCKIDAVLWRLVRLSISTMTWVFLDFRRSSVLHRPREALHSVAHRLLTEENLELGEKNIHLESRSVDSNFTAVRPPRHSTALPDPRGGPELSGKKMDVRWPRRRRSRSMAVAGASRFLKTRTFLWRTVGGVFEQSWAGTTT